MLRRGKASIRLHYGACGKRSSETLYVLYLLLTIKVKTTEGRNWETLEISLCIVSVDIHMTADSPAFCTMGLSHGCNSRQQRLGAELKR
jgi:hypothetical protein